MCLFWCKGWGIDIFSATSYSLFLHVSCAVTKLFHDRPGWALAQMSIFLICFPKLGAVSLVIQGLSFVYIWHICFSQIVLLIIKPSVFSIGLFHNFAACRGNKNDYAGIFFFSFLKTVRLTILAYIQFIWTLVGSFPIGNRITSPYCFSYHESRKEC